MDDLKVQLITSRFNRMLEEFAEVNPEVEFRDIVRAIAIRVIAGALRRTRAASIEGIRKDWEEREWVTLDGKKYNLFWYLKNDALWGRLESLRADKLARRLESRGLSKKSWLHQAEQLGGTVEVPAYVRSANYKGNSHPENVQFRERTGSADYALTIVNSSPIVQAAGGREALVIAMAAETRYFYTLLARGGFKTAQSRAAKYPGVYVRPAAAATLSA